MRQRSRLSKHRQDLVTEYVPLARMLARFFLKARPGWQKAAMLPDLEAEGFLALTKAARTYDKKRLPYPKAYFARAVLNSMCKAVKKSSRQPGSSKISLEEAGEIVHVMEHPDYLGMAIRDLDEHHALAQDRFQKGHTLRTIAADHGISLRLASVRSRALAKILAQSLDIRLPPPGTSGECPLRDRSRSNPSSGEASSRRPHTGR